MDLSICILIEDTNNFIPNENLALWCSETLFNSGKEEVMSICRPERHFHFHSYSYTSEHLGLVS